jgi:putative membrane protein
MLLALPLLIFTLGLFMLVINALLLYLVSIFLHGHFEVDGFWAAFWGALLISVVSVLLNSMTGSGSARVEIHRGRRPPNSGPGAGGSGSGPVIDV